MIVNLFSNAFVSFLIPTTGYESDLSQQYLQSLFSPISAFGVVFIHLFITHSYVFVAEVSARNFLPH